jgi:hypothetical protein
MSAKIRATGPPGPRWITGRQGRHGHAAQHHPPEAGGDEDGQPQTSRRCTAAALKPRWSWWCWSPHRGRPHRGRRWWSRCGRRQSHRRRPGR